MNILGIDIGGTKCAVSYGVETDGMLHVVDKHRFATTDVGETIANILLAVGRLMGSHGLDASNTDAIGISCGGPLDSERGIVMSPPNLPGWDDIPIVRTVEDATGVRTFLQNDANACALAEYRYGAGKGSRNMVFLTFGTGMGAGIIIDGRLYGGANGNAGEVGHVRLSEDGTMSYGKKGSFEGFCSGGGIAQLAQRMVRDRYRRGDAVPWCPAGSIASLDALRVSEAARSGDALALDIMRTSATYLGMGVSMIIDILNPDTIVIGSVYARNEQLMRPCMMDVVRREALGLSCKTCRIVPAGLGEAVGDFSSLSVGADGIRTDS